METVNIPSITRRLRQLPAEKLVEVYDFVNFLIERGKKPSYVLSEEGESYLLDTMIASEMVLQQDWDTPEEDKAWANL
ncbi:MAG: DUF2281 domain-containing protein [Anaerolineae bacterium]|nr:DUF2281 domain-containing protein [Anaerolineae bacterium]